MSSDRNSSNIGLAMNCCLLLLKKLVKSKLCFVPVETCIRFRWKFWVSCTSGRMLATSKNLKDKHFAVKLRVRTLQLKYDFTHIGGNALTVFTRFLITKSQLIEISVGTIPAYTQTAIANRNFGFIKPYNGKKRTIFSNQNIIFLFFFITDQNLMKKQLFNETMNDGN